MDETIEGRSLFEPAGEILNRRTVREVELAGGPAWPVLFVLPSRQREEHLHENLPRSRAAPVATAPMECLCVSGPARAVWMIPGSGHQPKSLIDLVR